MTMATAEAIPMKLEALELPEFPNPYTSAGSLRIEPPEEDEPSLDPSPELPLELDPPSSVMNPGSDMVVH